MKRGAVETYPARSTADRIASVVLGAGGLALAVLGNGWPARVVGAVAAFFALARWLGVKKRAVFQTDEFLVLRGSLFSRRLAWADVASAGVARRTPVFFGLVVTTAGGRKYRPGGVGYFGLRRQTDQPVNELAAGINARAGAASPQPTI